VTSIQPGTPAAMIGLQQGDRILAVNNMQISSPAEFQRIIATTQPGAQLPIVVFRNGQRETLFWSANSGAFARQQSFGFAQQNFGINWSGVGGPLAVADLAPNSVAMQIGLRPGDQIVAVNNVRVSSPAEFQRAITTIQPGTQLPIVVYRNGVQQTLYWAPTSRAFAYSQHPGYQAAAAPDQTIRADLNVTPAGRPFLGVTLDPSFTGGALVTQVASGGPAERAGVRSGDLIVRINQQHIDSATDLTATIARMRPGTIVDIGVSRRQTSDLQLQLGSSPAQPAYGPPAFQPQFEEARRDTYFYRGDNLDNDDRFRVLPGRDGLLPGRDADNDGRREGLFRDRFDNR
jgi:S1-C subfamily serine protease